MIEDRHELLLKIKGMSRAGRQLLCEIDDGKNHVPGYRVMHASRVKGEVMVTVRCLLCGAGFQRAHSDWFKDWMDEKNRELIRELEMEIIRDERHAEGTHHSPPR